MKFRILLSLTAIVAATGDLHAQYTADALRFSQTSPGATARFQAIGAQYGVGGDLSSMGGNPAGIGLFTRSEFSLTPEFNSFSSDANYLGQQSVGKKDQFNLSQASVVWHSKVAKPRGSALDQGLISVNFGLGYNRTQAYGNNISFSGTNPNNSAADYYAEMATSNFGNPSTLTPGTLERMAYDNYLIGYDATGYYFPETDVNNVQTKSDMRGGSQSDLNFAFGANFSNKFYLGLSLGIASINYNSYADYTESGYNVTEANDYQLSFRQDQITKGAGFNGKLGAIFRPADNVRIGATFQSPTWFTIDDSYTEVLNTQYGRNQVDSTFTNTPQQFDYTYKLRTPMKVTGGIGVFFSDQGFISADVDYVDYSSIYFSGGDGASSVISDNNRAIMNNYKSAMNYRVGGEYKLESLMLRAGYGLQGNPYKDMESSKFATNTYSAGIGYRVRSYYVDLTYQNVSTNVDSRPYTLEDRTEPVANLKNSRNNVFLTVGSRF